MSRGFEVVFLPTLSLTLSPAVVIVGSWSEGSVDPQTEAVAVGTSIFWDGDSNFPQLLQHYFMTHLEPGGK